MKALFIGGSGNISTAVSKLAIENGIDLYLLNRGTRPVDIEGVKVITADINKIDANDPAISTHNWDVVVNWIAFDQSDVERDYNLFKGRTKQYIFISSASAYQKPLNHPLVTESTPLHNPYWDYSRNKIDCEDYLMDRYKKDGFPVTIVRPSLTYDTVIPVAIGGWTDYGIINRMKSGKKVIVHGDGTSIWTITHSEDFAKGFVGLMNHQQAMGEAFHITSDELLTWNQIYEAVGGAVGVKPNIIHIPSDFIAKFNAFHEGNLHGDKAGSVIFDNSKIKRYVPDYVATIPFSQGIKRTIEWFEADPTRMVTSPVVDQFLDKVIEAYEVAFDKDYGEVPIG